MTDSAEMLSALKKLRPVRPDPRGRSITTRQACLLSREPEEWLKNTQFPNVRPKLRTVILSQVVKVRPRYQESEFNLLGRIAAAAALLTIAIGGAVFWMNKETTTEAPVMTNTNETSAADVLAHWKRTPVPGDIFALCGMLRRNEGTTKQSDGK
jgi:hypothetical protein